MIDTKMLEMRVQALEQAISSVSDVVTTVHLAPEPKFPKAELFDESAGRKAFGSETGDVSSYTNLTVPVYHRDNDVSVKSAAISASTKYWVQIDEDYGDGAGRVTLESGAAWGTPDDSVSIFRILETDADKMATFYRYCWISGSDLRAADITETSV